MVEVSSSHTLELGPSIGAKVTGLVKESDGPSTKPQTVDELLLSRVSCIPDNPLLGYPATERGCSDYIYYTPRQLDRFADGAVNVLLQQGLQPNDGIEDKVVALLAPSNLDYVVAIFALQRLRCTVLLLSNRLATEAYVNLLDKTNCNNLVVSESMAKSAVELIKATRNSIQVHRIPERAAYSSNSSPLSCRLSTNENKDKEDAATAGRRTAFIIHSSGSTGLPKPIFQTHAACLSNYSNGNGFRAFLTLPLFHNHGLSTFFRAVYTGTPIALCNANLPLSATNLVEALECVKPESFHGVPYALKLLSEVPRGVVILANCKLVLFGGSSCPDDLGDKLVDAGVYLVSHYGATELGQLMTSFRDRESDKAWNYVRPTAEVNPYLYFAPRGNNSFELVVLDGWKSKVASNSDDPPNSFHTSDLFTPHPTIPDAWRYLARNDDRITLVNGEKVLPVPFENYLRQNELVREALLFGIGKPVPGLFIIPSIRVAGRDKSELLERIWPEIEIANGRAEAFGQISKDMVEILDADVEYPATDKGTLIRAAFYKKFAAQIESVYQRFEGDDRVTGPKLTLSIPELERFVLDAFVEKTKVGKSLELDSDFFNAGIDSLQALTVRALLKRKLDVAGAEIGQNVVFEYPSVRKLARHLYALRTGESLQGYQEREIEVMQELISKYSVFEKPSPALSSTNVSGNAEVKTGKKEVVLLTGTTGSLGAHILAQLLTIDTVKRVYCPVRAKSTSEAFQRVTATLAAKKPSHNFNLDKITALPSDFGKPDLGLGSKVISDLQSSLTTVIHSAWAVNFNLGVGSFEQQHIRGVANLIKLCLSSSLASPAQFFFCSSISAAAGTPLPARISESPIPELAHAQQMGYARSKLVAERIVQAAAETTGMVAKVVRIGQIIGDTEEGVWNETEAIPLMIRSAVSMGALPALDETPSWMPVDLVAKTVLDLSGINNNNNNNDLSSSSSSSSIMTKRLHDSTLIYQVQNPQTFNWTADLLPALRRAGLADFEIIPQREWVRRLRDQSFTDDATNNPTIKLVDFFAEKYDNDNEIGRRGLVFETERTEEASPTLKGGFDVIRSGIVEKMVKQWKLVW